MVDQICKYNDIIFSACAELFWYSFACESNENKNNLLKIIFYVAPGLRN
jgi:hypothetical protein